MTLPKFANHTRFQQNPPSSRMANGFSLIELLVSMGLLAIIGGIGVSIFAIINTSYNQSNALSQMQTQGSQVLEVIERSVRGASNIHTASSGSDGCLNTLCLIAEIPSNSIEYEINGQCSQTVYGWNNETASQNGTISRYYLDDFNNLCNGTPIVLFDDHTYTGISVTELDGEDVFTVIDGPDGVDAVEIAFNLSSGVDVPTDHANVPLRTTVGLRDY